MTRFLRELEVFGESPALVDGSGHTLGYAALAERADAVAAVLGPAEGPGGRKRLVQILMDNSREAVIAYVGALRAGHAVMLADHDSPKLWQAQRSQYRPDAVFEPGQGMQAVAQDDPPPLHPDLALLLSTSGTTGSTKSVRQSKDNLDANARAIAQSLGLRASDRAPLMLPLHYCYGLSVLNSHLAVGASLVTGKMSLADPGALALLRTHAITNLACVPFSIELLERHKLRDADLPSLRFLTQAGGRLEKAMVALYAQWARETGREFFVMYGQTEATARMSVLPPELAEQHPDSIGRPIPGGQFSLVDDDGAPVDAIGEPGEIVYAGPNVMLGYAEGREDLDQGRTVDALHTGDIARRDADGLFYVVGRKARFSKLYGKRLNLDEAEAYLAAQGRDAVCVSDDRTLFAVVAPDTDRETVAQLLVERFDLSPRDVLVWGRDGVPRLTSGKVDFRTLLAECVEQAPKPERAQQDAASPEAAAAALLAGYGEVFSGVAVQPTDSFLSLNGDSLSYVQTSLLIEEVLGRLPDDWETRTIAELSQLARDKGSSGPLAMAEIETGVLVRLLAPLAVVMNHAELTMFRGGAALLLLVSGQQFARFQGRNLFEWRPGRTASNVLVNVLLPYWLVLIAFQALKGELSPYDALLINNLIGVPTHPPFGAWFVQALCQSIVLLFLFFGLPSVRAWGSQRPFAAGLSFFGLAAVARVLDGAFWLPAQPQLNGGEVTYVLWMFALGFTLHFSKTTRQRAILSVPLVFAPVAFYTDDWSRILFVSLGALWLMWLPRVHVPAFSRRMLAMLGASSLFIYMLHPRARIDMFGLGWSVDVIRIVMGVLLGVVGWKLYHLGLAFLIGTWRRLSPRSREAAR